MIMAILAAGNGISPENIPPVILAGAAALLATQGVATYNGLNQRAQEREVAELEESIEKSVKENLGITDADLKALGLAVRGESLVSSIARHQLSLEERTGKKYEELANIRRDYHLLEETKSRFKQARIAFLSFLAVTLMTTAVLLYGGFLALDGNIASGVVTALCGAIPGTFSLGLYRLLSSANKRSDDALKGLRSEVESQRMSRRTAVAAESMENPESREALKILGALRAAMPNASPSDLSSMLSAIRQSPTTTVHIDNRKHGTDVLCRRRVSASTGLVKRSSSPWTYMLGPAA